MIGLLLADLVIWGIFLKLHKKDCLHSTGSLNPLYDKDLDELSRACDIWGVCPSGGCEMPKHLFEKGGCHACTDPSEKDEDRLILQSFEEWAKKERIRDKVEEYLWEEEILLPEDTIWCDGTPLEPGNPEDYKLFLQIKDNALLQGMYNSMNLNEGGEQRLHLDWFKMKGCSEYGANMLLNQGIKPWQFELE